MTFRKWLVVFLILLFIFLLTILVYAGPGDEPVKEHPWDEVKYVPPTIIKQQHIYPTLNKVYFYSVLPFNSSVFMLVVGEKNKEVIKKDLSVKNFSLPRKK